MTFAQRRQAAQHLRALALERVLPLCGARRDEHDKHKWHTSQGALSVTGPKFMDWNRNQGGGGAIDLVMHLNHLDFKAAVDWLAQHFPDVQRPVLPQPLLIPASRPILRLPPAAPGNRARVRDYLVGQRALARALLDPLFQAGVLYADARANAVFLLLGKENLPVGAELRGTTGQSWRGLAPGSQKDLGYFAVPCQPSSNGLHAATPIILCESAIDALSCLALHPHCRCLSTAGARPNPLWLKLLLVQPAPVYCGFDADAAGDQAASAMMALHPAIKRLRPPAHDWNEVLKLERP
jgi:hypothetical protein